MVKNINDVNSIGDDLFSFALNYDQVTGGTALFNGNISATSWKTANTDSSLKHYTYGYDALNRITSAIDSTTNYNLNSVAYDLNGNIQNLERKGHLNMDATTFGIMDNLSFNYDSGNKLLRVTDAADVNYGFKDGNTIGDDYDYDLNGNLLSDANKGIRAFFIIISIYLQKCNLVVAIKLSIFMMPLE